ncbi:hypothetical protein ABT187_49835 [Streptomyces sp. NPDC001817]|uniref:hypothetical protein n=1 Tax=Streptomyces sp. NPDC001817 TaxID=3154398 RepID=UPI00332FDFB1
MVLAAASVTIVLGYDYLATRQAGARPAARGTALSSLCDQPPAYFPGNASYKGSGPHPIAVFQQKNQNDIRPTNPVEFDAANWARTPFLPSDAKAIQLVACATRVRTHRTGRTCILSSGHAPLYQATYRVTVVAVTTGQSVGEVFVRPQSDVCPPYPMVELRDPKVFSLPSAADYARELSQFSDRPAQEDGFQGMAVWRDS